MPEIFLSEIKVVLGTAPHLPREAFKKHITTRFLGSFFLFAKKRVNSTKVKQLNSHFFLFPKMEIQCFSVVFSQQALRRPLNNSTPSTAKISLLLGHFLSLHEFALDL